MRKPTLFAPWQGSKRDKPLCRMPVPAPLPLLTFKRRSPHSQAKHMIQRVRQRGEGVLSKRARILSFANEKPTIRTVSTDLVDTIESLEKKHVFRKGIGLAAPQVGHSVRIFAVKFPGGDAAQIFINPQVLFASEETDRQFEGCLSFFEVRGSVMRHRRISIRYYDEGGRLCTAHFSDGDARLIQHELDHLDGVIYSQRMEDADRLVDYDTYLQQGHDSWEYPDVERQRQ